VGRSTGGGVLGGSMMRGVFKSGVLESGDAWARKVFFGGVMEASIPVFEKGWGDLFKWGDLANSFRRYRQ
jgi:hypothetical protein